MATHTARLEMGIGGVVGVLAPWILNYLVFPELIPDSADVGASAVASVVGAAVGAGVGAVVHQRHSKGQ